MLASGTEALENHDFARAAADLQRAGKLLPRNFHVFSRLGAALAAQNQWGEAVKSYSTAIEIAPDSNDYVARGRAYTELKAVDKAMDDFKAAVRTDPNNAKAYVELGDAYLDKDDLPRAIAAYSEAIRICTSDAGAYPQWNARLLARAPFSRPAKRPKRPTTSRT